MDESLTPHNEDKLRALRNNLEKLSLQSDFRKKVIGGLSEDDVIKYIDGLRQQSQMVEDELSHHIEELQHAKEKLLKEYEQFKQETREEKVKLQEIADKAVAESAVYMQECQDHAALYNMEIDKVVNENQRLENERNQLEEQVLLLEKELGRLNSYVNEYTNERKHYRDQIVELEQEILSNQNRLNEQIKLGEDLERKFEFEKSKTASAAKDISSLRQKISNLEEAQKEKQVKFEEEIRINQELVQELELERSRVNSAQKTIDTQTLNIKELEEQLLTNIKTSEEYLEKTLELEQELEEERRKLHGSTETIGIQNSKIEDLEKQLFENIKTTEEYLAKNQELEQELKNANQNSGRADSSLLNFKGEVDVIYKTLDNIKVQIDINDKLQQQLDHERSRAERVEKDMAQISEWAYNLKEKFHLNQRQLEVQFGNIEEKHKAMQSDINGLRSNLETFSVGTGTEIDNLCATVDSSNQLIDSKCVKIDQWREKTGTTGR
ncbi:chromosome partition protein smc [hydrocarbon metagenome]|uniref:Chromosome partition protein smc n=1 Tax=hydrocarbon metagenome TaxID=938273 RepID=A0A0W8E8P3_9ZZZZ